MFGMPTSNTGPTQFQRLEDEAINFVYFICGVICQPVEILLRWWYGTRYFAVPVTFFSASMMLLLPIIGALFTSTVHMIPFMSAPLPRGMFDLGSFSKLYFLLTAVHGFRLWRRMLHMEREQFSDYEGEPLPFFHLLPKSGSFWFIRIVWEPLFVLAASIVLEDLFIIQPSLALYLRFAALALLMKSFIAWHQAWLDMRIRIDIRNAAPIIAKLVDNEATEEDLAPIHLCSIPKNIDPEIRKATIAHIARNYTDGER
jgi:hypothetical protein